MPAAAVESPPMAKLYFYYSAMNAGKTTNLLQSALADKLGAAVGVRTARAGTAAPRTSAPAPPPPGPAAPASA